MTGADPKIGDQTRGPGPGRPATVADVHRVARSMPHVTVREASTAVYQVGGKSFVYFRTPSRDAVDEATGERLDDVTILWTSSAEDKQALLAEDRLPLFTTPHFDGHASVLVRASRLGEMGVEELTELVQDAWLGRASRQRGETWLRGHGLTSPP